MQTVLTYKPDMEKLLVKKAEIYRYLGYTDNAPKEEAMEEQIESVLQDVLSGSRPMVCYGKFHLKFDKEIDFGFMQIKSDNLSVNLKGCKEAVIFAATIGLHTDKQIKRQMLLSPAKACIYQAVGAAVIEAVCDDFNEYIRSQEIACGNILHPRYSPGYGDLSLEVQKDIFTELECAKYAGITLSDSLLMIPEKSVTAIIGIEEKT